MLKVGGGAEKKKKMRFEPGSSISSTCCTTIHVSHMGLGEKTRSLYYICLPYFQILVTPLLGVSL